MELTATVVCRGVLPWMVVCLGVAGTLAAFRHLDIGMTQATGGVAGWCSTQVRAVTP
jgi:hypothetical protein